MCIDFASDSVPLGELLLWLKTGYGESLPRNETSHALSLTAFTRGKGGRDNGHDTI